MVFFQPSSALCSGTVLGDLHAGSFQSWWSGASHWHFTGQDAEAKADEENCAGPPSWARIGLGIAPRAVGPPKPALFTTLSSDIPVRLQKSPLQWQAKLSWPRPLWVLGGDSHCGQRIE